MNGLPGLFDAARLEENAFVHAPCPPRPYLHRERGEDVVIPIQRV